MSIYLYIYVSPHLPVYLYIDISLCPSSLFSDNCADITIRVTTVECRGTKI